MHKNYKLKDITLDKYQSRAVFCAKNNYLIIAGAGSGKTLTIVAKINYLIENGVDPKEILCISFTNETVNSIINSLNKYDIVVDVMTFHKLALNILPNKYKIAPQDLLKYTIEEFFQSLIYFDETSLLLKYINDIDNTKKLIYSFIMNMKSLNIKEDYLYKLIKDNNISKDDKVYLTLILKVYLIYEEELRSEFKIDFDDIINLASERVKYLYKFKYKYIIIDEYQDTSISKYNLIKNIIDRFNIRLISVGDDYQSIYSFTGCKLSLFTKYKKYFKDSKIIKLKYTYRNPNDIVQISKRFIMKNRNQINKRLISNKYLDNSIYVVYSDNEFDRVQEIINSLDHIMIIGRNNRDIEKYNSINGVKALTAHKSKGLEEDNVIIVNAIDDCLGFPNKIIESRILDYIRESDYEESERRLFYVALSRCKKRVFILTEKGKESIYVKELLKEFKYKIKIVDLEEKIFK